MLRLTRKGQLEIMGLVIVVVLISLAMLFLLKFVVFKPVAEEQAAFTGKKLAVNTLGAMMETTTECRGMTVTELIQECASFPVACNDLNSKDSCESAQDLVTLMLEKTLQKWKKHYHFVMGRQGSQPKFEIHDKLGCPGERESHFQPLPDGIFVKLDVC